MNQARTTLTDLRREHPVFFWGMAAVIAVLLAGALVVGSRIPVYRADAAMLDRQMSETEREMRDRILASTDRRAELALALWRRELQLRALQESELHLALSIEDSVLELRHGPATLRRVRVEVGPDSVIRAPDGRTWRFVRALGERHVREKQVDPVYSVPEWVYLARGEPAPPEAERRIEGGLGRYVLRLDDGTEIYSRPTRGPLAETVKPAAFRVEEADLRAIFEAVGRETPVYIY